VRLPGYRWEFEPGANELIFWASQELLGCGVAKPHDPEFVDRNDPACRGRYRA
jgi:hypothetical protein